MEKKCKEIILSIVNILSSVIMLLMFLEVGKKAESQKKLEVNQDTNYVRHD